MNVAVWVNDAARRVRYLVLPAPSASAEPSRALFRAIRWRLAIWYSGVLAIALLLAGTILYASVRHSVLAPIDGGLQQSGQTLSEQWTASTLPFPGAPPACSLDHFAPVDTLYVCYDVHGVVLAESRLLVDFGRGVSSASLAQAAARNGVAQDMQATSGPLGTVERYAVRVPTSDERGTLGVIQVVASVGPQLQTLDTLLHLMYLLGALTILFAGAGGLFLANRALLPARLAHARQRDFIADASHELRTPLTMLRSNVEVVLRGAGRLPPEDVALLRDTVTEAAHLTALANTMLDLARVEREGAHLEEEIVDLGELANEVIRWAGSLATEHGVCLRAQSTEPVLIVGDRSLLTQAMLILIDNAIKYNRPQGAVDVRTWIAEQQAHIEVRDSGIGIEATDLARLGERFYRVDKARSRESGGAGLGLSLVRSIVARHGGALSFASIPGEGTTVTLSLPTTRTRRASPPPHRDDAAVY